MKAKNHDYTGGDDPFSNFRSSEQLGIHPVVGILLRMQDKIKRINTFATKGELKVKDESVNDAVEDIINYAILIKGMLSEKKGTNDNQSKHKYNLDYPVEYDRVLDVQANVCKVYGTPMF
jgi:hypothetical protein